MIYSEEQEQIKWKESLYQQSSVVTFHILWLLLLYRDLLLSMLWNYSSSTAVSRAAVSCCTRKLIWLPCHSSCNFNSQGTVKWRKTSLQWYNAGLHGCKSSLYSLQGVLRFHTLCPRVSLWLSLTWKNGFYRCVVNCCNEKVQQCAWGKSRGQRGNPSDDSRRAWQKEDTE